MAQTGYTPILLYSSSTGGNAPAAGNLTNSTFGSELAINITDGKLFYKDNTNAVQVIAWKTTPTTAGGTGLTSYTAGDLPYYATGTTLSKLAIGTNGQILSSNGTAPQWTTLSGVAVTTFSAGTTGFTPNSATSGAVTLAGTLNVGNGGTGTATAFTAGSVVFAGASGVYSQDNANFFWDDSNDRLGIGTATPSSKISISTSSGASNILNEGNAGVATVNSRYSTDVPGPQIQLRKYRGTVASPTTIASGDQLGAITFQGWGGSTLGSGAFVAVNCVTYNADTDWSTRMVFLTRPTGAGAAAAERMRITDTGLVGIGTTSPSDRLQVTNNANSSTIVSVTNSDSGASASAYFRAQSNDGSLYALAQATGGGGGGTLYWDGTNQLLIKTFGAYPLAFGTNNTEKMRIFSSGGVSIGDTTDPGAGALRITDNLVIATSGKGIDFSATAGTGTSELFDDYEEGTWTPTITNVTGTYTTTSVNYAQYTKIGEVVYGFLSVTVTTSGTASANMNFTLPFTPAREGYGSGRENVNTGDMLIPRIITGGSGEGRLYKTDGTAAGAGAGTYVVSFMYLT